MYPFSFVFPQLLLLKQSLISSNFLPVGCSLFSCERPPDQRAVFPDRSQLLLATAQLDSILITGPMGHVLLTVVDICLFLFDREFSAYCPRPQFTTLQYSSPGTTTAQSVTLLCAAGYFSDSHSMVKSLVLKCYYSRAFAGAVSIIMVSSIEDFVRVLYMDQPKLHQIIVCVPAVFKLLNLFR
jgi:hypothetical protein